MESSEVIEKHEEHESVQIEVIDDGLVHIEGQPDICFKLGHGEWNMFTFQVYHKGQPVFPIIPTTARFTVYNKTRNENIRIY